MENNPYHSLTHLNVTEFQADSAIFTLDLTTGTVPFQVVSHELGCYQFFALSTRFGLVFTDFLHMELYEIDKDGDVTLLQI